jgi:interferon-induced GTP-binding protein Mx
MDLGFVGGSMDDLRALFDVIDDLGQLGLSETIPIPRIVVVGDQSAGKSSVLQTIANIELPQGTGTVTRCPLVLRMQKTKPEDQLNKTMITISWPGRLPKLIDDVRNIADEVREATKALTGNEETAFSEEEIQLTIKGPGCPDLTLVDLPGIVRHVRDGQDRNVKERVRNMIRTQIEKKESIIAAVVACGDLETSEALSLAQEFDPEKQRTIGILTKPDLQDRGTNMSKVLSGQEHFLKNGYIVVKNRGQQDIDQGQSWSAARVDEEKYFENHEVYGAMANHFFGASNLVKTLQPLLRNSILLHLPGIRARVKENLNSAECELQTLETGLPETLVDKLVFALKLAEQLKARILSSLTAEVICIAASEEASVHIRSKQTEFDSKIHDIYLSLRAEDSPRGPLFLEFSFLDASVTKIDHDFVIAKIVPCLGITGQQRTVQIEKIVQVHNANGTCFLLSDCSVAEFNQRYIATGELHDSHCVYMSAQAKQWLFFEGGYWLIGSDSTLTSHRFRGKACPESLDNPALSSDWAASSGVLDSKLKVERLRTAWRVEFSALGDPPERAEAVSQFLRHIHTRESQAIFGRKGLVLLQASVPTEGGLTGTVRRLARKCRGPEPPGYCSSGPFQVVVRGMIDRVQAPAARFASDVQDVALQCLAGHVRVLLHALPEFQLLAGKVGEAAIARLHARARSAALLEVEKERAVLFTNNKNFANTVSHMREARRGYVRGMLGEPAGLGPEHGGSNDAEESQDTEDRILAYAKVVYKRVADSVPMAVHHCLVLPLADEVFGELARAVMRLYAEGGLDACLAEGRGCLAERGACRHRVAQLRKAAGLLDGAGVAE